MKTMFALYALTLTGCASIQSVGDLFASVDRLNAECHQGVIDLTSRGVNIVTFAQCDAAAAKAKADIQALVARVRSELVKEAM